MVHNLKGLDSLPEKLLLDHSSQFVVYFTRTWPQYDKQCISSKHQISVIVYRNPSLVFSNKIRLANILSHFVNPIVLRCRAYVFISRSPIVPKTCSQVVRVALGGLEANREVTGRFWCCVTGDVVQTTDVTGNGQQSFNWHNWPRGCRLF